MPRGPDHRCRPLRRRQAQRLAARHARVGSAGRRPRRAPGAQRRRPGERRPGDRWLRPPARHAGLQRDAQRLAGCGAAHRGAGGHGDHPVRLGPGVPQPGPRPHRRRPGRRGHRLRGRGALSDPDGLDGPHQPRLRPASRRALPRALRGDHAVRGRRAHRRGLGHQPPGHRRTGQALPGPGRGGLAEGRFDGQIIPVEVPVFDEEGHEVARATFARDEGLRETSLEALAGLRLNTPERSPAVHTAGSSSQISDGASATLLMSAERAQALGLDPRARLVETLLVGSDPELMLTGPIPATPRCSSAPASASRTSTCSRSTRPSPRSCWPGSASSGWTPTR